ncbi:hypothetical protein GW17_00036090 [Ensete ventricosum]|nr:hypothetical protein GW17_00036090 [Ensete ventricosum]
MLLELWKRSELAAQIRLPEAPVRWRDVHRGDGEAVAGGDAEREGLAVEVVAALPVLAPVAAHRLPPEIKVVPGRIAPPSIVVGKRVVWRAEVSGGNDDRTLEAPLPARAFDLEARPAALPVVEESRAQCSALGAIPLVVEITITACPSCDKDGRSNTMSGRRVTKENKIRNSMSPHQNKQRTRLEWRSRGFFSVAFVQEQGGRGRKDAEIRERLHMATHGQHVTHLRPRLSLFVCSPAWEFDTVGRRPRPVICHNWRPAMAGEAFARATAETKEAGKPCAPTGSWAVELFPQLCWPEATGFRSFCVSGCKISFEAPVIVYCMTVLSLVL